MTQIVWNGCDGYIEADSAYRDGYNFDGRALYKDAHKFDAFDAIEIDVANLPKDADGEPILDGLILTESGKCYIDPAQGA